jgi:hypothetical protein
MAFFVTGAAPGGAAPGGAASSKGGLTAQSLGCSPNPTFSEAGPPAFSVCVTDHGNIDDIDYAAFGSPVKHVNKEGYCLLTEDYTSYYDNQYGESGWGPSTVSRTSDTMTVIRTTLDGRFTLRQNIYFKYGSRMVLIGNLVTNNDSSTHLAEFNRYFDGDIDGSADGDVYEYAGSSELATDRYGLMLTSLTGTAVAVRADTFAHWNASGARTCIMGNVPQPTAPGDYVGALVYDAYIPAHGTVNFKVGYRLM